MSKKDVLKIFLVLFILGVVLTFVNCGKKTQPAPLKIGVFKDGVWYIDRDGDGKWDPSKDKKCNFGASNDMILVGDWNGDGIDEIGVFRKGMWYLDFDGDGLWDPALDKKYAFGGPEDTPLVGDWNNDGKYEIGVFRKGSWYLDYNGNGKWEGPDVDKRFNFGSEGQLPVIGRF